MLLSPEYSVNVRYFGKEARLERYAEVFFRELFRYCRLGNTFCFRFVAKEIVSSFATTEVQRSRVSRKGIYG